MGWGTAIVTGFKVWTTIKPFKRWKERRQAKKRMKELGIEEGSKVRKYKKLIVMVVGAVLAVASRFVPVLEDTDAQMLVEAVILGGTAVGVWGAKNDED